MYKSILILLALLFMSSNAFALVPSDVSLSPAVADFTVISLAILNVLLAILGYRKILSMLR